MSLRKGAQTLFLTVIFSFGCASAVLSPASAPPSTGPRILFKNPVSNPFSKAVSQEIWGCEEEAQKADHFVCLLSSMIVHGDSGLTIEFGPDNSPFFKHTLPKDCQRPLPSIEQEGQYRRWLYSTLVDERGNYNGEAEPQEYANYWVNAMIAIAIIEGKARPEMYGNIEIKLFLPTLRQHFSDLKVWFKLR